LNQPVSPRFSFLFDLRKPTFNVLRMNTPCRTAPALAAANFSPANRKKSLPAWLMTGLLLLTLATARADQSEDDYLSIYITMDQADTLSTNGNVSRAHAKYAEAQQALAQFHLTYPKWNPSIVTFRLNYLADKIAATSGTAAGASAAAVNPAGATASASAPAVTTVATSEPAVASPAAPPVAKSPVKLLDAGAEPRTVLRLHPVAGDQQAITMTMKMGMFMSVAGNPMPATDLPSMIMSMDVAVKDIAAGTNTLPAVATAMKTALASINGMTGTGKMSSCGIVKSVEMKPPATAAPQISQTLDQMKDSFSSSATPLPEEAVGPGAKWEYKTRLKSQGMNIDQTITCELVSIDGDVLTLHSTLVQNAANQKISNPAMPGLKMDLTKMTGNGTIASTLNLGKLMPQSATVDSKTEVAMAMNVGQQKQAMDMKMNIHVAIEAK